ncbi:MAG: hypothetical protein QXJ38_02095 [Thermofilaceae archaeon]
MEATAKRIAELLSERGYEVTLNLGEQPELIVKKNSLTVYVLLAGRYAKLEKLYVRPARGSGVTVVNCEDITRVCECVERLIKALEFEESQA